jgi:Fe-S cluster assembly scaffold protein SufB
MESSVRHYPVRAATALALVALSSTSNSMLVVDAFTLPQPALPYSPWTSSSSTSSSSSSSSLCVSIGLGPENDGSSTKDKLTNEGGDELAAASSEERIIRGEDGLPLPYITDFEPYRNSRMSNSDRDADAWFTALLTSPSSGGGSDEDYFLGSISQLHKERLLTKVELVDEPKLRYGVDEEWTPYVSRRLPSSPLYPAYGLETYGLPVLRRGAEAWRNFDVNGLIAVDYSSRPLGIGSDYVVEGDHDDDKKKNEEMIISSLKEKGAWLDDDDCTARLVYINGRYCPGLSKPTNLVKNLDSSHFEAGLVPDKTLEFLSRLPDGFTDQLAAEVPDESNGPLTSFAKLSGPDHSVGKATSQFAINNQQGSAAFAALNSVKAGCVAYIESDNEDEKRPVLIVNAQTPSGGSSSDHAVDGSSKGVAFHPRTLAVVNNGCILSLVQMCVDLDEDSVSSSSAPPRATLKNGYTQIFVGSNSNVTHSFLEESGGIVTSNVEMSDEEVAKANLEENPRDVEARRPALRNTNFEMIDVHITGDNGSYDSSILELGGSGRSRLAISASLLRPGAMATINGFALSGGAQRTDMRSNIHHMAQGTTSRQEQRNMVGGRSTASFRGRIRVEQSAQQTDSEQLSRTILLSDHARIWATPSLEIIADDVQCKHGATVSDLSEEELFYLRSRGLDRTLARNLLMYAFVEEIGSSVDKAVAGGFNDENGLRQRIIRRLENVVPKGEKTLVGGEFQSV